MAYNKNTVQTAIQERLLPKLWDNIFTDNHYFFYLLKQKAKIYNERRIQVALEYAKHTIIKYMDRGETISLSPEEIATMAYYDPKMLTGSITIYLEDQLENKSDQAIFNILKTKTKNLQRSIEEYLAGQLWTRGSTLAATKNWNTIDYLVNNSTSVDVGDVLSSGTVPSWWLSNVVDVSGTDYTGVPNTADHDLEDDTSDVYLKRLIQRGIAKSKYQTGQKPDLIVMPQYLWDLLELQLEKQKEGSPLSEKIGSMGFSVLTYRGISIVADDDMVAAQTDDTDGRIYFFNMRHLYMFVNSGAKFTISEFVTAANQNADSALVNTYGNVAISNRKSQTVFTNLYSPKSYAA